MSQPEDAATIATEYISTLDNIPNELQYLLAEIREREERIREFQERIQSRTSQYTRHAQKSSITEKDETSLLKVQADLAKITVLADEKVELAKRIQFLILKARGKLHYDLQRIQNPPEPKAEESSLVYSGSSRTPLQPVIETLKSTLAAPSPVAEVAVVVVAAPSPSPAPQPREGARESKRRKLNSTTSQAIIAPVQPVTQPPALPTSRAIRSSTAAQTAAVSASVSTAPTPIAPAPTGPTTRPRRSAAAVNTQESKNADKDEEMEDVTEQSFENDGENDDGPYCICQQNSYGEMIGCDNGTDCPYQWFHLPCVNVAKPLPPTWYCDDCSKKLGLDNNGTSGNVATGSERGRKRRTR